MKSFNFNFNDYVLVTLTKEGAEHLSKLRKEFYDAYPHLPRRIEVFAEGYVYRTQFWSLISDFHEMMHLGAVSTFVMGKLEVESSLKQG